MKKRLLLSGPIGCGKSTLIRNTLGDKIKNAGGYVTERITDSNGKLIGFDLLPSYSLTAHSGQRSGHRFLTFENDRTIRDNTVFKNEAVQLLSEASQKPFVVIDEFGGYELMVPEFATALISFMQSDIPCVGVLKTFTAAKKMQNRTGLSQDYLYISEKLRAALESDPNTEILETIGKNDIKAETSLRNWAEEYANV